MNKEIKYTYITRKKFKRIFYIGSITGALMWSIFGGLNAADPSNLYRGLCDAGLVLLTGTIAFCGGMFVRLKE